jgi:hypothetical protein
MVTRVRLNEKAVREAEPADGRDYQIFDTDVRGFAVCIYRSGSRAFALDYRHAGRQRRMTIGRWPEWSTTAARGRAKELRREIDAGGDPLGQREQGREAPRFQDLIDRYVEVHLLHLAPTNASDQKSMLKKLVAPDWGNRLVTEITPYDVEKLLNKIAAGRARPSKAKPNNRAHKLQGTKPTPIRLITVAMAASDTMRPCHTVSTISSFVTILSRFITSRHSKAKARGSIGLSRSASSNRPRTTSSVKGLNR